MPMERVERGTCRIRPAKRRDAGEHGPAASEHARRAAAGLADRRRGGRRGDAAHRLSAPLGGEDRRTSHAAPVHPLHRPHGLPGRGKHEPRLFVGRREVDGPRNRGEGPALAGDDLRAVSHRQPSRGRLHLRPRPGQLHAVHLGVSRAGTDSQPVRGPLRRTADAQLHRSRRRDGRPSPAGCKSARSSSSSSSR